MPKGRPRIRSDGGAVASQNKNQSLTNKQRLEICRYARGHGVRQAVARYFSSLTDKAKETKRKQIYEWLSRIDELEDACKTVHGRNSKRLRRIGPATTLSADAERLIVLWINGLRSEGVPVPAVMLELKAKDVAAEFGITPQHFQASWTWQRLFLRRHRLTFRRRTRCGQIQPQLTEEIVQQTNKRLNQLMVEHDVDIVYNADQTAVFSEYIPETTIDTKGARAVWARSAGKEKERVTVMLLGDSHGRKYTPFTIVKMVPSKVSTVHAENVEHRHGFGTKAWPSMELAQRNHGMQIHTNARGWWTSTLSCRFLRYHFGCRANPSTPVLLLWDDFSGHWTTEVRACAQELNVVLVPVPPGYTSVCQPADIAWNFPLKARLRRRWIESIHDQLRSCTDGAPFKLQAPARDTIMEWVGTAWFSLSSATIANGFRSVVDQAGEETDDYNALVDQLSQLDMLDGVVGEVCDTDDVVAAELEAEVDAESETVPQ